MNKASIVAALSEVQGISKASAERNLEALLSVIKVGLNTVGEVTLSGVGKLKVSTRAARVGRNPNTGAELQIPEKTVLKFKESSLFVHG